MKISGQDITHNRSPGSGGESWPAGPKGTGKDNNLGRCKNAKQPKYIPGAKATATKWLPNLSRKAEVEASTFLEGFGGRSGPPRPHILTISGSGLNPGCRLPELWSTSPSPAWVRTGRRRRNGLSTRSSKRDAAGFRIRLEAILH